MAKSFQDSLPERATVGKGDYIPDQSAFITVDATEQSHTLQNGCFQIEIKNLAFFETVAYSDRARISLLLGGTADSGGGGNSGQYIILENGESIVLDVIEKTTLYFKRDAGVDIALSIRERMA